MSFGPWDWRMGARALVATALALGLAIVVISTTEEGGPPGTRSAILVALTPLCATAGATLSARWTHVRGESRALQALGMSPFRIVRAAAWMGVALGALAVALAVVLPIDLGLLMPPPDGLSEWQVRGLEFWDIRRGFAISSDGEARLLEESLRSHRRDTAHLAILIATAAAAVVLPTFACRHIRRTPVVLGVLAAGLAEIMVLHMVVSMDKPVYLAAVPALALLAVELGWQRRARRMVR